MSGLEASWCWSKICDNLQWPRWTSVPGVSFTGSSSAFRFGKLLAKKYELKIWREIQYFQVPRDLLASYLDSQGPTDHVILVRPGLQGQSMGQIYGLPQFFDAHNG